MTRDIRICTNHDNYQVPLIGTFAFNGAEYWCPYCGYIGGMFGAGKMITNTEELQKRHKGYKKFSKKFLRARSIFVCASLMWKGERIKSEDLPDKEKTKLKKICENWKYKVKL